MQEKGKNDIKPGMNNRAKASKTNNSNNKVFIVLLVIIAIIIIAIILIRVSNKNNTTKQESQETNAVNSYVEEVEDGIKLNKSSKLNEAKEVQGLQISNIQLTTESGMTTLLADVKNITEERKDVQTIEITLINEDGSEIATITGIINSLDAEESTQLNIATTSDYVNAYDFKVSVK